MGFDGNAKAKLGFAPVELTYVTGPTPEQKEALQKLTENAEELGLYEEQPISDLAMFAPPLVKVVQPYMQVVEEHQVPVEEVKDDPQSRQIAQLLNRITLLEHQLQEANEVIEALRKV